MHRYKINQAGAALETPLLRGKANSSRGFRKTIKTCRKIFKLGSETLLLRFSVEKLV